MSDKVLFKNSQEKGVIYFLVTAGILLGFFVYHSPVLAADLALTVKNPDPYTGNQSWFVYKKEAGQVIQDIASVKNFSNEVANIRVYAVDANNNESGNFILKFAKEEQKSIGAWTEVKEKNLTIQPNQKIDIPFSIKIPNGISPGQYLGGIVIESAGDGTSNCEVEPCDSKVNVKTRIGSRIYLTVPGEVVEKIDWKSFTQYQNLKGTSYFKFNIVNEGNISYEPRAKIVIKNGSGQIYDQFERNLGTIVPKSTSEPTISWEKPAPFFGDFTAEATVTFNKQFDDNNTLHGSAETYLRSTKFTIIPWLQIIIVSGTILVAFGTFFTFHHYRCRCRKNCEEYTINENEDIMKLADDLKMNWKKIAWINKLKPPYVLRKGDKVVIPKAKK